MLGSWYIRYSGFPALICGWLGRPKTICIASYLAWKLVFKAMMVIFFTRQSWHKGTTNSAPFREVGCHQANTKGTDRYNQGIRCLKEYYNVHEKRRLLNFHLLPWHIGIVWWRTWVEYTYTVQNLAATYSKRLKATDEFLLPRQNIRSAGWDGSADWAQ